MDAEGLLGNIQHPWKIQYYPVDGLHVPRFLDTITGSNSIEDPRLGAVPLQWEQSQVVRKPDDPLHIAHFENKITGEVINSDPRMLPGALEERGVKLRTFQLV